MYGDGESAEAEGITLLEGTMFARFEAPLVDVGAVRAAEVLDLEPTRSRCGINCGVTRRGRWMVDFETQTRSGLFAPDDGRALMDGPEFTQWIGVERDQECS